MMNSDQQTSTSYGTTRRRISQHSGLFANETSRIGGDYKDHLGLGKNLFGNSENSEKYQKSFDTIKISRNTEWRRGSRALLFTVAVLMGTTGYLSVKSVRMLRANRGGALEASLAKSSVQMQQATATSAATAALMQPEMTMQEGQQPQPQQHPMESSSQRRQQSQTLGAADNNSQIVMMQTQQLAPQQQNVRTVAQQQQQLGTNTVMQTNVQAMMGDGMQAGAQSQSLQQTVSKTETLQGAQPQTETLQSVLQASPQMAAIQSVQKTESQLQGAQPQTASLQNGRMENSLQSGVQATQTLESVQMMETLQGAQQQPQTSSVAKGAANIRHRPLPRGNNKVQMALEESPVEVVTGPGDPPPPDDRPKVVEPPKPEPVVIVVEPIVVTPAPVAAPTTTTTESATDESDRRAQEDRFNPVQDQMLIVSTVASMALLVGAISARKLRSKPFLSACIENESLEDDLAYDTENTFGGMGQYGSFSAVGWRGDLEKFDV